MEQHQTPYTKQGVITGIRWSAASQFGRQAIQIVSTIVLARLLFPSDFGLASMTFVVTGFITLFSDLGTSSAIIQKKDISGRLLSSIYWINVSFGFLVMGLLLITAPLAAWAYKEPRLTPLLIALSSAFPISGVTIVQKALLERELEFDKLARIEIISTGIGAATAIVLAFQGAGVWSLVGQALISSMVATVILWKTSRWRPQLLFNWSDVTSVSSYSLNLVGFSVVNYISRNADYILIGRFLGAQDLGYYSLAYRLMLYPLQNITGVISRVMFPFFSQIQEDDNRLRQAYLKIGSTIAFLTFPMMLGLIVVSKSFVSVFFGARWAPVAILLMILAPVGMIQSLSSLNGSIYGAKGRTDLQFRFGALFSALTILSFIIGLQWGIIGVAASYAIAMTLLIYPSFLIPFRIIHMQFIDFLAVLRQTLLATLIMFISILILRISFPVDIPHHWIIIILVPVGCIAYLIASWWMNRQLVRELIGIVGGQK